MGTGSEPPGAVCSNDYNLQPQDLSQTSIPSCSCSAAPRPTAHRLLLYTRLLLLLLLLNNSVLLSVTCLMSVNCCTAIHCASPTASTSLYQPLCKPLYL